MSDRLGQPNCNPAVARNNALTLISSHDLGLGEYVSTHRHEQLILGRTGCQVQSHVQGIEGGECQ